MAIRASSAAQINALVADLIGADAVARDAAIARLTVIGARAVERLAALAGPGTPPEARAAALRALEGIGDDRALEPALAAVDDGDVAVARAAVAAARVFIRGPRGDKVVDRLTAAALDAAKPEAVRLAAVRALGELEPSTVAPLWKSLAADGHAAIREAAAWPRSGRRGGRPPDPGVELARAAGETLPDDPARLRHLLTRAGDAAPLPSLLQIVEKVREREASATGARRGEWTMTWAAAHLALARRGSRIALYDLKESVEKAAAALPVDALAALSLIGDASCLEPIASACVRATDAWWRRHLLDVFDAIVNQEHITRRHPAMKAIAKKWPAFFKPRRSSA